MHRQIAKPRLTGYTWRGVLGLCPRLMGVFQCLCSHHGHGSYRHSQWILDYSFTPFGSFRARRNTGPWIPRPAHEAHLYAPDIRYWEDTSNCGSRTAHSVYVVFAGGEKCGLSRLVSSTAYARFSDPNGELSALLSHVLTLSRERGEDAFWPAQALLCDIVGLLDRAKHVDGNHYIIQPSGTGPVQSEMVSKVRAYCQEHIAGHISRHSLAQHLGMSISTLAHRYQEETGESPMATLMAMRLNLAKGLLLKGNKLKAIAEQTGFCDAFQLSKIFKKWEGLSPREFLKSMKTVQH